MSGYIIYSRNELTNDTTAHEIDDIECTVDKLFTDILEVDPDVYTVSFGDEILNELDKDTMLADIGLCPESTVNISTEYSPSELKIITEYSLKHLEAYRDSYNYSCYHNFDSDYESDSDEDNLYDSFIEDFVGEYPPEYLNDFFVELMTDSGRFTLPKWVRLDHDACLEMLKDEYEWLDRKFMFIKNY